jgi:hypothetical protein
MKYTNEMGLPKQLQRFLENSSYDGPKGNENKISVTTLLGSPLVRYLKHKHWDELEQDVSDSIWMILGSAVHGILEQGEGGNDLTEERLELMIDGVTLSGSFDYYDSETKSLQDYKVTSSYSVRGKDSRREYAKQLNIYKYLFTTILNLPVEKIENVFILRDHTKKVELDVKQALMYDEANFKYNKNILVYEQEILTNEEILDLIRERIKLHTKNEIYCCSDEERYAQKGAIKVMREGRSTSLKNFSEGTGYEVIEEFIQSEIDKAKTAVNKKRENYSIVEVAGDEWKKCDSYCQVSKFCPAYKERNTNWSTRRTL